MRAGFEPKQAVQGFSISFLLDLKASTHAADRSASHPRHHALQREGGLATGRPI